jgi:hypothetical protein
MFRRGGDFQVSLSNPSAGGCSDNLAITQEQEQEHIDLEMK